MRAEPYEPGAAAAEAEALARREAAAAAAAEALLNESVAAPCRADLCLPV